MHKTRVITLVLASILSASSLVQAQAPRGGARGAGAGYGKHMAGRGRGMLLRGITLSDAERSKLKEIHGKYAGERRALRDSLEPVMKEVRTARQKGDTVALRAIRDRNAGNRTRVRSLMERERTELRSALTVENQRLFDANVKQLAERRDGWAKDGQGGPGRKGHHKGHGRGGRIG